MFRYVAILLLSLTFGSIASSQVHAQFDRMNQRYALVPFQDSIILLDTQSGETWILRKAEAPYDPPMWQPIARPTRHRDSANAPEARLRDRPERRLRDRAQPERFRDNLDRLETDRPLRDRPREGRPERDRSDEERATDDREQDRTGRESDQGIVDKLLSSRMPAELLNELKELENNLTEARSTFEELSQRFGSEHPQVQRVRAYLEQATEQLRAKSDELLKFAEEQMADLQKRDPPRSEEGRVERERLIEALESFIRRYRDPTDDGPGSDSDG